MMGSKAGIYAFVALVLGFVLISVVPSSLVDLGEGKRSISPPRASVDDNEKFGLGESQGLEAVESELNSASILDGAMALGIWIVDIFIALGIYLILKRLLN